MVKLADERMLEVQFTDDAISVSLRDGASSHAARLVSAAARRHRDAAQELENCRQGYGIHWPTSTRSEH